MRRAMRGLDPNDPDDTLLNWLWASLTEPGWSYANMCFWRELPPAGGVSIDLQSCEMAAMMAETLEILRPWVDSVSTTLAATIIKNIDDRVVVPWGEGHRCVWDHPEGINNWVGACSGTILAACEYPRRGVRRGGRVLGIRFATEPARAITHVFWSLERPVVLSATAGESAGTCRIALGEAVDVEVTPLPSSAVGIEEVEADDHGLRSLAGQTLYQIALTYAPEGEQRTVTRFSTRTAKR